jgi:A/G-specific adenine glycosylase
MAHAVLCFAFEQDVPIIDQNVVRIFNRVFSLETRKDAHRDSDLWKFAQRLVPKGKARQFNWGLIDFGAVMCTPANPQCVECPILEICDYGRNSFSAASS